MGRRLHMAVEWRFGASDCIPALQLTSAPGLAEAASTDSVSRAVLTKGMGKNIASATCRALPTPRNRTETG